MDFGSSPELTIVQRDWTFTPTTARKRIRLFRLRDRLLRRVPAPARQVIVAPTTAGPWSIYFIFAPDGLLAPVHRMTLDRLAALDRRTMVVCAAPSPADIPTDLTDRCDALVWKGLQGFDFSAYAAGLETLAVHAPGSDALVMNDSVYGPLVDLTPWLDSARWDLTGFTATSNVENHIQSYAFFLKNVTPARIRALAPVFLRDRAYDDFWPVVFGQETRFARIASRSMTVGSFCYVDDRGAEDPMLQLALPMVEAGFPFLKRSLIGKLDHLYPREQVIETLVGCGYPAAAIDPLPSGKPSTT